MVFLIAPASFFAVGEATPPTGDDPESWPRVFRHICENSRLQNILVRRPVLLSPELGSVGYPDTLCLVGPFLFTRAHIYFELYPAEGTDELWVLGGHSVPVARLKLTADSVEINVFQDNKTVRLGNADSRELPGILDFGGDTLRINSAPSAYFHDVSSDFPTIAIPLEGGGFLGIPCAPDSCHGCGFAALFINLPEDEAERWRATVSGQ